MKAQLIDDARMAIESAKNVVMRTKQKGPTRDECSAINTGNALKRVEHYRGYREAVVKLIEELFAQHSDKRLPSSEIAKRIYRETLPHAKKNRVPPGDHTLDETFIERVQRWRPDKRSR